MVNSRFYIRGFSDSRCPIRISLSAPKHSETCHVSLSTPNNVLLLSNKDIPKTAWKMAGEFSCTTFLMTMSLICMQLKN